MNSNDNRKYHTLSKVFFLDVLLDQRTRPIFIYAFIMVIVGAVLYHYLEGGGWLDAIYFVVITLTTIGYGDLYPTQGITKVITIFYGLNGIILLLMLFDVVRTLRGWEISRASQQVEDSSQEGYVNRRHIDKWYYSFALMPILQHRCCAKTSGLCLFMRREFVSTRFLGRGRRINQGEKLALLVDFCIFDNNKICILDQFISTPLMKLRRVIGIKGVSIFVKNEFINPGGSLRDRMAMGMVEEAERIGELKSRGILLMLMIIVMVVISILTGRSIDLSTTWFTMIAVAGLAEYHSTP